MYTLCMPVSAASIARAAAIVRSGGLVAFPTETVYGLGADALSADAVSAIFAAKGRPADNPLIVHVAELSACEPLCALDARARALARAFWPGPLTLLLPKSDAVPDATTAGLPSVAIRMPSHPAARALIKASDVPIAAPSANLSGRPSPTSAAHVFEDMAGRVDMILDGGACAVGVESTVLDLCGEVPVILRPGGVTLEMLRGIEPDTRVADSVMRPLNEGEAAPSPGMRHRHYAPRARMLLVRGTPENVARAICELYDGTPGARILAPESRLPLYAPRRADSLGADGEDAARTLFSLLRKMDDEQAALILCEAIPETGIGLAVMNRMARAAAFEWVDA